MKLDICLRNRFFFWSSLCIIYSITFVISYTFLLKFEEPHSHKEILIDLDSTYDLRHPPLRVLSHYDIYTFPEQQERSQKIFRFPHFRQKISKKDIYDSLPFDAKQDCFFCEYPNYSKSWIFNKNHTGYTDAFLSTFSGRFINSTELVVVSNVHPFNFFTKWNQKVPNWGKYNLTHVKLKGKIFFNNRDISTREIGKTCEIFQYESMISIHCKVEMDNALSDNCFDIQFFYQKFGEKKWVQFVDRIPVRHCEKRDQIMKQKKYTAVDRYSAAVEGKKNIAFCIMISHDNSKWIIEWLEYHLMIGVDHFYVYIHLGWNNEFYNTEILQLLDSYIMEGRVTVVMWEYSKPIRYRVDLNSPKAGDQKAAFTECIIKFGYKYKWMGFFDDDEFLTVRDNLIEILKKYESNDDISELKLLTYVMSPKRIVQSELVNEIYGIHDEILPMMRKSIVKTNMCVSYENHECGINRKRETKPSFRDIVKIMYFNRPYAGYKILDHKSEVFMSHFFYRKYHDYNPIELDDVNKKVNVLPNEFFVALNENLRIRKEIIKWKSFNFVFNETKDMEKDNIVYKVNHYSKRTTKETGGTTFDGLLKYLRVKTLDENLKILWRKYEFGDGRRRDNFHFDHENLDL